MQNKTKFRPTQSSPSAAIQRQHVPAVLLQC